MKIESTPPAAPPLAHYDDNVGNTCHETTDDIHFEMSDTRIHFVERQNYFHKQSILGIEIFTDQRTIQDGAMQYFCSVNGEGSLVYETFVPIYSTSCVTAQTD